jgi:hypothetical protein
MTSATERKRSALGFAVSFWGCLPAVVVQNVAQQPRRHQELDRRQLGVYSVQFMLLRW